MKYRFFEGLGRQNTKNKSYLKVFGELFEFFILVFVTVREVINFDVVLVNFLQDLERGKGKEY